MSGMRGITAVLVLLVVAGFLSAGAVSAADAKAATGLGTVDIDKAYEGYNKSAAIKDEINSMVARAQLKLDIMRGNKLLTDQEITELVTLNTKPKQEDADRARIEALQTASRQRDQELASLEQKQDVTDEERGRRQSLLDQRRAADEAYKKAYDLLQQEIDDKRAQLLEAAKKEILDTVAVVAKEKGISIVFNRNIGPADFIVYSAADITDDVVKKLNKK